MLCKKKVARSSIIAIFFGKKSIDQYFLQKKIESAFLILNEFKLFTDDIEEIGSKIHWHDRIERDKLIHEKLEKLKQKIHQSITQLSGEKTDQMFKLIKKLETFCKSLSHAIYIIHSETHKHQLKIEHVQKTLSEYPEKLKSFYKQTQKTLKPII